MFRNATLIVSFVLGLCLFSGCAQLQALGGTDTLTQLLTSQLGVTQNQATGGVGSVLTLAKEKMSSLDFNTITALIPGADTLMKTSKDLGAVTGPIGNKAGLEAAFSRLGMGADNIPKFIQTMGDFVGKTGGDSARNLLASLLTR